MTNETANITRKYTRSGTAIRATSSGRQPADERSDEHQLRAHERAEPVTAAPVESLPAVAVRMDGADARTLRESMDKLKDKLKSAAIVLATVDGGKVQLAAGLTQPEAVEHILCVHGARLFGAAEGEVEDVDLRDIIAFALGRKGDAAAVGRPGRPGGSGAGAGR